MNDVIENFLAVQTRIENAAIDAVRPKNAAALTAVSKTFPADHIRRLLQHGHRQFGENRVQEAKRKWPELRAEFPDIALHLIGPLQTNKAEDAVSMFDVIEVLDREKLAHSLVKAMAAVNRRPEIFIQINTGAEEQKGGIVPSKAVAFAQWAQHDLGLPVAGMMAIPPADEPPAPHFALVFELAEKAGLARRSMGMSSDFETAVHMGATDVRVGSAIFGARS